MLTRTDLKPCPFCGADGDNLHFETNDFRQMGRIECQQCGACGPDVEFFDGEDCDDAEEEARSAWNRRARNKRRK